jgi:hypothetical protein
MANGQNFTLPAALYLAEQYQDSTQQVFYDHGGALSRRIYAWFGATYTAPNAAHHLAWVDIVVAEVTSSKVYQIIEIEDSTAKPKTIIADLMAVLLGDGLAFGGRTDWQIGHWTTLIVCAYVKDGNAQTKFQPRLAHLQQHITAVQAALQTHNAAIGRIVVETFTDRAELHHKLTS